MPIIGVIHPSLTDAYCVCMSKGYCLIIIIGRAKRAHMGDTSGIFHILLYIIVRTSGFV